MQIIGSIFEMYNLNNHSIVVFQLVSVFGYIYTIIKCFEATFQLENQLQSSTCKIKTGNVKYFLLIEVTAFYVNIVVLFLYIMASLFPVKHDLKGQEQVVEFKKNQNVKNVLIIDENDSEDMKKAYELMDEDYAEEDIKGLWETALEKNKEN